MRQILFLSLSDSSSGTAPEFRACFDLSSCWTSASSTYSTSSYVDAISIPIIVTILSRQSLSDKESARVLEDRRLFVRWAKTWTDLSSILTTFSPTTNIFQNYCGCCCLTSLPHPSSSNTWTNTIKDPQTKTQIKILIYISKTSGTDILKQIYLFLLSYLYDIC